MYKKKLVCLSRVTLRGQIMGVKYSILEFKELELTNYEKPTGDILTFPFKNDKDFIVRLSWIINISNSY